MLSVVSYAGVCFPFFAFFGFLLPAAPIIKLFNKLDNELWSRLSPVNSDSGSLLEKHRKVI
jgi:hypothetical protein